MKCSGIPVPLAFALVAVTLLLVAATGFEGARVKRLQLEQQAAIRHLDGSSADPSTTSAGTTPAGAGVHVASGELLKLRSEVARLTARNKELAAASVENARLRSQLANAGQTATSQSLPPGYVRKSAAQYAGFTSPENTMQTFLWALHRRDITNLLQAFTPGMAKRMSDDARLADPAALEKFLKQGQAFVGYRIVKQQQNADGSMNMQLEIMPDMPPEDLRFELVNGEWKVASHL